MVHPYDQLLARMTKVSTASLIARAAVISSTPYSITWKQGLIGFEKKVVRFEMFELSSVKKVEARIDRI